MPCSTDHSSATQYQWPSRLSDFRGIRYRSSLRKNSYRGSVTFAKHALWGSNSHSCVAWQTVIEYTCVWRSATLNCRQTSLKSAHECLPDCPHFFAGADKIRYWLHVLPLCESEFHENRCTESKLRPTDSVTFAPCVLRFPPISVKRGTEDVHRSLPSSCRFRENRPREDRTFRRGINASTVKQYGILNVKNAFVKPVYYVTGFDIVILLTLHGGTCLLSVCPDVLMCAPSRLEDTMKSEAVSTTEWQLLQPNDFLI